MSEMKITFKHPDEILDFVNTVSKYEFDMDMKKGHVVVDAKSLLGIMHLGINNEIALQMYTDDCEELCREIAKYAAALIKPGDFVYIDAGTTTDLMIDFITTRQAVFVTNAIKKEKVDSFDIADIMSR